MEYLQYELAKVFKESFGAVLNLIINGIPSIQNVLNGLDK